MPIPTLLAVVLAGAVSAGGGRPITLDWIFSDEGEAIGKSPEAQWTSGGDVLFLDPRRPKAARTLERFSPGTGAWIAVDPRAALASLSALLGGKDVPEELEWPPSFDGAGTSAAYAYGGDLFRLDLASSRFERLTATTAEEKIPGLSPDGRELAFVRGNDLWVLDLASKAETRLTSDGSDTILNGALSWLYWEEVFDHKDSGYWWSPDSAAIAFLRTDESSVSEMSFVDFAPAVPRVVHQRYPKAGGANPTVRLGIVDVSSRKTAWLDPAAVSCEYLVQVRWEGDGRQLGIETLNRRQDRSDVYLLERSSAAARRILTDTDPAWVNLSGYQLLQDGQSVLHTVQKDGHARLVVDTIGRQETRELTPGSWSVRALANWQASTQAATLDEARRLVYFTARKDSLAERQLYRVGLDGAGLQRISSEPGCHKIDFSPDRSRYLDWHSARDRPPSLSIHEADGKVRSVLVASPTEGLKAFALSYPEFLTIPAGDGHPLQARLYKPAGFDASRRHPVIFYVYGEPNAPAVTDEWRSWPPGNGLWDQVLLQNGYLVLTVDPRTSTSETKAMENLVLKHVSGEVEANDVRDAARWLKKQPWVDPERIGIWGWSGGGTTTLLALTRTQEFKAGIAVAPVTDRRYYDTKYAEAYMKTPDENAEGYDDVSLVKRAKDLHGRLLIVHGTYDDNVHSQNTWAFVDALVAAGKPVDMMVYPMRKHDIADRAARRHLYEKMLEFWKLWLP